MLSASHWLLAQARFCGRTHLPLSPNSTTPTVQVIFRYLRTDAPVFNITTVGMVTFRQSPCWYYSWADIILSTSCYTQHLWTWWHFGDHTGLINLSATSAVFTPAGLVNILHFYQICEKNPHMSNFACYFVMKCQSSKKWSLVLIYLKRSFTLFICKYFGRFSLNLSPFMRMCLIVSTLGSFPILGGVSG